MAQPVEFSEGFLYVIRDETHVDIIWTGGGKGGGKEGWFYPKHIATAHDVDTAALIVDALADLEGAPWTN